MNDVQPTFSWVLVLESCPKVIEMAVEYFDVSTAQLMEQKSSAAESRH